MNERDSEQVARSLVDRGYSLASHEDEADIVLLNSCSVRDQAEQKALGKMGFLASQKKGGRKVLLGVIGCMAQRRGAELLDRLPDLDLVAGTQQFHRVAEMLDRLTETSRPRSVVQVEEQADSQDTIRDHLLRPGQPSAFVSIMQGCDMRCSFCIVPDTRGQERSRPIPSILEEVRKLADAGVKEVTLLGQIVNLYGRHEFPTHHGQSPFVQLLYAVQEIHGIERIRFTSPHPTGLKEDLIKAFVELPKLCEHMHLPLQSGSDRILRAMRRSYTRDIYLRKVESLRTACPSIGLTSDIIVGFPGETEEDFLATAELCKQIEFDNAFIFRYSPRTGTPSAQLHDDVTEEVKLARNQILLRDLDVSAQRKADALLGTQQEILVEGPSRTTETRLAGRTRQNRLVVFPGPPETIGSIRSIKIIDHTRFTLYGETVLPEERRS